MLRVARGAKKLVALSRRYVQCSTETVVVARLGSAVGEQRRSSRGRRRAAKGVEYSRHLCGLVLLETFEHHVGIRAARDVDVDEALGFIQLAGAGVFRLNPQRNGGRLLCLGEVAGVAKEASSSA